MSEFPTGVNVVAVCPNLKLRNTLIRAIEATSAIKPAQESTSESAQRAHYWPSVSKLIINTAAAYMLQRLGKHSLALAVEVPDRMAAAFLAQQIFRNEDFESTIHPQAEPEFPDGFIVFLQVPALEGILLMFWPRPQDVTPDVVKTLPKRVPWSDTPS